ncbi:hypothetical protein KY328_03960 [Candidatus Woesearchaeota archaeon]|nr:hypothetical protein [Candidatus Woesearchaeota archaeon]MBW3022052.1 hypothetical protein [Candidatus Woesearchaeota archaeon]
MKPEDIIETINNGSERKKKKLVKKLSKLTKGTGILFYEIPLGHVAYEGDYLRKLLDTNDVCAAKVLALATSHNIQGDVGVDKLARRIEEMPSIYELKLKLLSCMDGDKEFMYHLNRTMGCLHCTVFVNNTAEVVCTGCGLQLNHVQVDWSKNVKSRVLSCPKCRSQKFGYIVNEGERFRCVVCGGAFKMNELR